MSARGQRDPTETPIRIDRRTTLAGLVGMAFALGGAATVFGCRNPLADSPSALRRRLIALTDSAGANNIGRQYLAAHAHEAAPDVLLAAIATTASVDWSAHVSERQLRARIRSAVEDDFARGQTVTLDGWILSVTEARLCALGAVG